MKLRSYRVTKFRNIVESGSIVVDDGVTCLVGKNEAGKSNLLEALYLFNPVHDDRFDVDDQYPRWLVVPDRRAGELADHHPIEVTLALDDADRAVVEEVLGVGVLSGDSLTVSKAYSGSTSWAFEWSERTGLNNALGEMPASVAGAIGSEFASVGDLIEAIEALPAEQAEEGGQAGSTAEDKAAALAVLTERGLDSKTGVWLRIVHLLRPRLPRFFLFTEYSMLPGRIDLADLTENDGETPGQTGLQTARALLRMAGTDLEDLKNDDYELRTGELEAVQIDLTSQVFEYWKQNPNLEVLVDVDKKTVQHHNNQTAVAQYLDIRLKDRRTGYSNNLAQRSSGFRWFFSFFAAFSEFESAGDAPVVLLDEPALTLHGKAQGDFLRFVNDRLAPHAPVLYTTHSPFLVEADRLDRVRIVEDHGPPDGVTATDKVMATDPDTLFPLQAALGYDIAQSLFIGPNNLLVEGTSEYIYLTILSRHCASTDRVALDPDWRIVPAGGATNIPTFVSLIGPSLDITVLADSDTRGMQRVTSMTAAGLLAPHRLILAHQATPGDKADTEDLFEADDYLAIYNETYGSAIKAEDLPEGDRIVKRIEAHLDRKYVHGEVAETLLRDPDVIKFSDETLNRFTKLFELINATKAT